MRRNGSSASVAAAGRRARGPALVFAGAVVVLLAFATACGSEPTATPQPTTTPVPKATEAPPTVTPTPAKEAWEIQWEETLAKAKEEGLVVITGGGAAVRNVSWFNIFSKIYGIEVQSGGGSSRVVADRIFAERQAGRYTIDMFLGGGTVRRRLIPAGVLDPIPPELILPEVTDLSLWYGNRHIYNPHPYIFHAAGEATFADGLMRYNTDLVSREEIESITSLWDMVDPRWNGRVATLAAISQGPDSLGMGPVYNHPDLGPDFVRAFFELEDLYFAHDARVLVDRILQGGSAVCLFCSGTRTTLDALAQRGAPINSLNERMFSGEWKDSGILDTGGDARVTKMNRAPHPNATRVLINWMLSREGQTLRHTNPDAPRPPEPTLREDVTEWGNTRPEVRRAPGTEYVIQHEQPDYDPDAADVLVKELYVAYVGL